MKLHQYEEKGSTHIMNSTRQNDHDDHDIEDGKSMITTNNNNNTKTNVQKDSMSISGGTGLLRYLSIALWIILATVIGTSIIYQSIMKKGVDGKTVRTKIIFLGVSVCMFCLVGSLNPASILAILWSSYFFKRLIPLLLQIMLLHSFRLCTLILSVSF
jgi:hypothetical protein